jgi:glutathione S-transferase
MGADFSAADVMLSFAAETAGALKVGLDTFPNVRAWLQRCRARPAYKRAAERGGEAALDTIAASASDAQRIASKL